MAKTTSDSEIRLELGREAGYEVEALLGALQREVEREDDNFRYFARSVIARLSALNDVVLAAVGGETHGTLESMRDGLGGAFLTQPTAGASSGT